LNVWRPDGTEVPGFPVYTETLKQLDPLNPENYRARAYRNANLANVRDPLSGGAAVGDLFHNGELEIVVTSTNGEVYAWDSHGRPLPGFPVGQDPATGCLSQRCRRLAPQPATAETRTEATGRRPCWPTSRVRASSTSS